METKHTPTSVQPRNRIVIEDGGGTEVLLIVLVGFIIGSVIAWVKSR